MSARILSVGTALPEFSFSQDDSCRHAISVCCDTQVQSKTLEQLYRKTKIERRHSVLLDKESVDCPTLSFFKPPATTNDTGPTTGERMILYRKEAGNLALRACTDALSKSGIKAKQVTHLITVSCTGFSAPGIDLYIINELGLNKYVSRTNIGFMGCHGAMNGLKVGQAYCQADPAAIVMICATELCSLHFQYGWDHDGLLANSLFADGSAAVLMSNTAGLKASNLCLNYKNSASYIVPESEAAMTWQIRDNGFAMTLGSEVPTLIESNLHGFITNWLETVGLNQKLIKTWAVHPGGPRILDAVETSCNLPTESLTVSRQILSELGNMSSPTILFIIERLIAQSCEKPWLLLAFGPGLTIEAAVID